MNRKTFLKGSALATVGSLFSPQIGFSQTKSNPKKIKKAKNIIFLVSDGMSIGTLTMTDIFLNRKYNKSSAWLDLYRQNKVTRALMDTASASSLVTDSAAASSSWGSGFRVNNGSLNIGVNGEKYLPIWQKFKQKGKKVGCVTTVPITHATPAGFCVNNISRNGQDEIALDYLNLRFDVMLGGGVENFSSELRKDKKDVLSMFQQANFNVVKTKEELKNVKENKPTLGVFYQDGLPYFMDREQDENLIKTIPTLSDMTEFAIHAMKNHNEGFVLQVESGKVDWSAHANDIGALIYEQIQFEQAVETAIQFAENREDTLVIICTDHGNANPGISYGKNADKNFDSIQNYKYSNDWILKGLSNKSTSLEAQERINTACNLLISEEQAKELLSYYIKLDENGVYNPRKLPFKKLAEIQSATNSVGWISMDHSADYVELAMFGTAKEILPPFIKNYQLHDLMLEACGIENKF